MHRLFKKQTDEEHNFWMSYTDLMSAFLVVFIILSAILYNQYNEQSEQAKVAEEKYNLALDSLKQTGNDLDSLKYLVNRQKQSLDSLQQNDLKNQILRFRDVFPYNSYIKVDFDTIRGSIVLTPRNPDPKKDLFAQGKSAMKRELQDYIGGGVGKRLIERTMDIWKSNGYRNIELRIEGHTDPTWDYGNRGSNYSYIKNLELSSERANNVYDYIFYNSGLSTDQQTFVKKNMISIGYSFSSRIQKNDVFDETKDAASRRIEFRIISR